MKKDITQTPKGKLISDELASFDIARCVANAMGRLGKEDALILRRGEIDDLCANCPPLRSFIQRAVEEYS